MLCGKPAHKEHNKKFCSYITAKVLAVDGPNGLPVEMLTICRYIISKLNSTDSDKLYKLKAN